MKFNVRNNVLYHGETGMGLALGLYVDSKELSTLSQAAGVCHLMMPHRIDAVFCVGGRVIGVESKCTADLVTSWRGKRLARQVRILREEVDVPVVLIRVSPGASGEFFFELNNHTNLALDLARLQMMGVLVVFSRDRDRAVLDTYNELKKFVAGQRNVLAAVAGHDRAKPPQRDAGWFLQHLKGIGPETASRLHRQYGSTHTALDAWPTWKVSERVKNNVREAMK